MPVNIRILSSCALAFCICTCSGFPFLHLLKFQNKLDILEYFAISFSLGLLYILSSSLILYIFNLFERITLYIAIFIPLLLYTTWLVFLKNQFKLSFTSPIISRRNIIHYPLILAFCTLSSAIHSYPALSYSYPIDFDVYRLHIIRVNYIMLNGREVIGDKILLAILNPLLITERGIELQYQWGFHMILGTLGILLNISAFNVFRILPIMLNFMFPLSVYTACPIFKISDARRRLLSVIFSSFYLTHPYLQGLIYPNPASVSLCLFPIILRMIHERIENCNSNNTFHSFIIITFLLASLYLLYLGIFTILLVYVISLIISRVSRKCWLVVRLGLGDRRLNNVSRFAAVLPFILLPYMLSVVSNVIFFRESLSSALLSIFLNNPIRHSLIQVPGSLLCILPIFFIYKLCHLTGITLCITFLFSLLYIFVVIMKEKHEEVYRSAKELSVLLLYLMMLSCSALESLHAVLYALPLVAIVNSIAFGSIYESISH